MQRYDILKKLVMEAIESKSVIDLDLICSQQLSPTEGLSLATEAVSVGILTESREKQGVWKIAPGLTEGDLVVALAYLCWGNDFNTAGLEYAWEAFKLFKQNPATTDKAVAICKELFKVSGKIGGIPKADYPGAIEMAKRQGNIPVTIQFMIRIIMWGIVSNSKELVQRYLPELKNIITQVDDPDLISSVTILESIILSIGGRYQKAVDHYESYLTPFGQIFTNPLFPRTCGYLIKAYVEVGHSNIASGMIQEIGMLGERMQDRSLNVFANFCEGYNNLCSGDKKRGKECFVKLIEESKPAEDYLFVSFAYMELAALAAAEEDWLTCVELFDKSIKLNMETGIGISFYSSAALFKAIIGIEKSQEPVKDYWPSFKQAIEVFRKAGNPYMIGNALLVKAAQLSFQKGSVKKRKDLLDEAESFYQESGSRIGLGELELERARLAKKKKQEGEIHRHIQAAAAYFRYHASNLIPEEFKPYVEAECCPRGVEVFQEVVDLITSMNRLELNPLLAKGLRTLCDLCQASWAGIWLPNEEGRFELTAGCNLTELSLDSPEFKPIINEIHKIGNNYLPAVEPTSSISSAIILPLKVRSKLIGILCYKENLGDAKIIPEELVKVFVTLFAVEIDHAQKYQEVEKLTKRLQEENTYYREIEFRRESFGEIIGNSPKILYALEMVSQVAPTDSTVLLHGETGSGKELFARAIHQTSKVSDGPFIQINCAAIPSELIESELFGHEKGAFTGAVTQKPGRFELANQGTFLMDEIGELSLAAQAKLLNVLQEGDFVRVGGTKTLKSKFRLIAATHRDLRKMVEEGKFREDLFYRLTVFPITIPPLRERKEDIPLLALYFLENQVHRMGQGEVAIAEAEMKKLIDYNWPGNVRELFHVIERGAILSGSSPFRVPPLTASRDHIKSKSSGFETLEKMEKAHILAVLSHTDGRISGEGGAAEILGINRNTLYGRMRKLGIR